MFLVDGLIFVVGVLILLGIVSSKLSARMGVPVLVLFLLLGMLAGSEGLGGILFDDYELAHSIGTVALVLILFDGGLGTSMKAVRSVWKPALSLATVGVLVTSVLTGLAAMWVLKFSWLEGLLLGSIVGSTDAAAVFAVLRMGGISLPHKLVSTIEIESGSNDPMAIFMTVGCIELLTGSREFGWNLLGMFLSQMVVGALVGISVGLLTVRIVNRINLGAAGLYPVLVTAFCLLVFGLTAWLGGSGFLAVYLAGIVLGNSRLVFQRGILLFHDAIAWLSQIVMFIVLGLLSYPSRLLIVGGYGLLIGAVLILVARPLAVWLSLCMMRFSWRELVFISWGGLKGAVPITLATFPLLLGAPQASLIFDITFFVVVVSALVQGWSLPIAAKLLKLEIPHTSVPPLTLEISSLRHIDSDIVDYTVSAESRAAGRMVKELALPGGVVIALISRDEEIIPPQGNTTIHAGDHVILVLRPNVRPIVDRIFSSLRRDQDQLPSELEFPLRPTTTVRELEDVYGIVMDADPNLTLGNAILQHANQSGPLADRVVNFGKISLHVRKLAADGAIEQLTMLLCPEEPEPVEPESKGSESEDLKSVESKPGWSEERQA
ncbi:MAG: potassium/proton antiporter [Pirellulaceae bacterium]|nr:potassium/proton antiporter [Pirellulaceae bacterium]